MAIVAGLCALSAGAAWLLVDPAGPRGDAGRPPVEHNDSQAVAAAAGERPPGALAGAAEDLATQLVGLVRGEQHPQPTALLIDRLREGLPLADRRKAAWRLAEDGTPDAMAALEAAAAEGPPYLRATIAEALGHARHPQARALLSRLLDDQNPIVARGAVRGIAASADPDAIDLLRAVLDDDGRPESVRGEAAVGLAGLADRESSDVLIAAFDEALPQDGDLWEGILEGLGSRPFPEVGDFYMSLVGGTEDPEVRTVAIESLSESTGEVVPFLLGVAGRDADPEVRAAAAWALGALEGRADMGNELVDLLQQEDDQEVRRNLYGAIGSQANASFDRVLQSALDEPDPDVRLQAFGSAARILATRSFDSQRRRFDGEIVPDLLEIALHDGQRHRQIHAFNALVAADTKGAKGAVRLLADAGDPVLGEAARRALARQERQP